MTVCVCVCVCQKKREKENFADERIFFFEIYSESYVCKSCAKNSEGF